LYLKPRNFYNKSIQMGKNSYDLFSNLIKITGDNSSKIVDSSKVPGRLSMLASSGFFNIYVIHLIRNGKQVCGSMKVRKKMPSRDKEDFTKPMPVWKSAIRWYFSNKTFIKVCKEYSLPVITIKYEDLVDKYDAIKHDLFSFLQLESNDYAHHANRHTISGSHWKWIDEGRFQSDIPKEKYTLNKFEKICFNLIAGRMYKKYGYK
ncbi:MAG: hypothetical protein OEY34_07440, partial [Cyclobacteriaceae bacterium]|nr:hypothetical protein [Cyclobacteriaceae bacterium]